MRYPYEIKRTKRKNLAICITQDCRVQVRAPRMTPACEIDRMLLRYAGWIERHMEERRIQYERRKSAALNSEQTELLKARAREMLPKKTAHFAELMGLEPTAVRITCAAKRWGSCSGKDSICFSYRVMLLPEAAIDYIVVHELAHIRHKNHGAEFYELISRYMPDHRERSALIRRLLKEGTLPL